MIPRYTPPEFEELWSSAHRYRTWLRVELAACEAMETKDIVPKGTAAKIFGVIEQLDGTRIEEIERTTKHDVIAFLTHVEELAGASARWLHLGMTSSDVLDTSLALLLVEATKKLEALLDGVIVEFAKRVEEHRKTPMIGRSHGIHAEPITFGFALAGHLAEFVRARKRLACAREEISVGKIAGAVGTYAHTSPAVEMDALTRLGLKPESAATQIVARDRHAAYFGSLAVVAASVERFATSVRHWQRTEVGEAEEAFSRGQKGSSAMPHKRNPVLSENLSGLARIVRSAAVPALENVALWHERDISHSSVERMIAPDATASLAFMLSRTKDIIANLVVYPDNMRANLSRSAGLWASEGVLLSLVRKGLARQEAYVLVQRNAMAAFEGHGVFADLLKADPDVSKHLSRGEIDGEFDLARVLSHVDTVIDRVLTEAKAQ